MKTKYYHHSAFRLISFSLLTIIFLLLLQNFLMFGAKHYYRSGTGKVNLIMSHQIDANIMVFGSSVSEVAIQSNLLANETKSTVFNASIDGTRYKQLEGLITEFLAYSENCNTIILGTSYFNLNPYSKYLTEPNRFIAHINNKNIYKTFEDHGYKVFLMKYMPGYLLTQLDHSFYKASVLGWLNIIKPNSTKIEEGNGWLAHYENWNVPINQNTKGIKIEISKEATTTLNRIIKHINKKGIKVVLVRLPVHNSYASNFTNSKWVSELLFKNLDKNDLMIDFSKSYIQKDTSFFYNHGHVNYKGAEKITKTIGENLNKKGYINTP